MFIAMIERFRALHAPGRLLVLANVWDAASARIAEAGGAPAVATSSAALAWACGYPDGGYLPADILLGAVERIARVVDLPLSVDVEDGYADDPHAVAELVAEVVARGASGINIEDGAAAPGALDQKIRAIKQRLGLEGRDVFVNARCDVYLRDLVPADGRASETIARGLRYAAAGADGFFVPFVEPAAIAQVARAVQLPLNVLSTPDLPALERLKTLGVRRLSAGSTLARSIYAQASTAIAAFTATGAYQRTEGTPVDLNALLS
jgi:2-methylisocitrate lyase-like PEP mutase family enzyme